MLIFSRTLMYSLVLGILVILTICSPFVQHDWKFSYLNNCSHIIIRNKGAFLFFRWLIKVIFWCLYCWSLLRYKLKVSKNLSFVLFQVTTKYEMYYFCESDRNGEILGVHSSDPWYSFILEVWFPCRSTFWVEEHVTEKYEYHSGKVQVWWGNAYYFVRVDCWFLVPQIFWSLLLHNFVVNLFLVIYFSSFVVFLMKCSWLLCMHTDYIVNHLSTWCFFIISRV